MFHVFMQASFATTMLAADVPMQAELSDAIVLATIGEAQPVATATAMYQHTTVTVDTVLGGQAPKQITLRQVGGDHNGRSVALAGDAVFHPGERAVLFVKEHDGLWYLTALSQSVWTLEGSGRNAQLLHDVGGLHLQETGPDGVLTEKSVSEPDYLNLGALIDAIDGLSVGGAQ